MRSLQGPHRWQRLPCKMPTAHQEQFGVQYLAQGHYDKQLCSVQSWDLNQWPSDHWSLFTQKKITSRYMVEKYCDIHFCCPDPRMYKVVLIRFQNININSTYCVVCCDTAHTWFPWCHVLVTVVRPKNNWGIYLSNNNNIAIQILDISFLCTFRQSNSECITHWFCNSHYS